MRNLDLMRRIRLAELEQALRLFPPAPPESLQVLEVGAGAGWQAQHLATLGYRVNAIDVDQSEYVAAQVFPVQSYDGRHIPFDDAHFDVLFSSNVLEHIANIDSFIAETRRVLRRNGVAVHILPSPVWRFWSNLAHPLWFLRRSLEVVRGKEAGPEDAGRRRVVQTGTGLSRIAANLLPLRHGERGNAWSELYYFSAAYWRRQFEAGGFEVDVIAPATLFYTAAGIFDARISLKARRRLAALAGSSCTIFRLTKPQGQTTASSQPGR